MKCSFRILILALLIVSCNHDEGERTGLSRELFQFSESLNPTQTFEINPNIDTVINGRLGTRIFIQANSLVFENGDQVTSAVEINLKEAYSIADMILNGLSTTSNGKLLKTSGMININASSDNRNIDLKSGSAIKIQFVKTASAPFMRTYIGQSDSTGINWVLDENNYYDTIKFIEQNRYVLPVSDYGYDSVASTITYGVIVNDTIELDRIEYYLDFYSDSSSIDQVTVNEYYEIHSTELNWINCDYFLESGNNVVVQTNKYNELMTLNFLVFHEINSIMSSWETRQNNAIFRNIPSGSKVTAIGISKLESQYYFARQSLAIDQNNQSINLDYEQASLEDIVSKLDEY